MGLFNKKEKVKEKGDMPPELPGLPKLPSLPENEWNTFPRPNQLPSLPNNSLGEKFSQDTIKEAVSGGKEGDNEAFDANEFPLEDEEEMMPKPLKKRSMETSREFDDFSKRTKKAEPVFIRIDKFEESLHLFEKAKKQISDIEKMLRDIKKIKDEEEKELEFWEKEIQSVKEQIEKVDKDIFSKIE